MTRRAALGACFALGGAGGLGRAACGQGVSAPDATAAPLAPNQDLVRAAFSEWQARRATIPKPEVMAVVDFSIPSYHPRLFLMPTADLRVSGAFLVAHGVGSDPGPTASPWPATFSNAVNSEASCIGGFITTHVYQGKHGLSLRIRGLDPTNDNAERRDVVIHSAPYVDAARARAGLPIERSQGCFAVTRADRDQIITTLRDGAFLFAGKPAAPAS